jgi:hypothetical protein
MCGDKQSPIGWVVKTATNRRAHIVHFRYGQTFTRMRPPQRRGGRSGWSCGTTPAASPGSKTLVVWRDGRYQELAFEVAQRYFGATFDDYKPPQQASVMPRQ